MHTQGMSTARTLSVQVLCVVPAEFVYCLEDGGREGRKEGGRKEGRKERRKEGRNRKADQWIGNLLCFQNWALTLGALFPIPDL